MESPNIPARVRARRSLWIAASCTLALVGTVAALLGARAVRRTDSDKQRLASHLAAADITSTLNLAIQHEEDLVVNASAFVTGSPNLTPLRFDRWLQSVNAMKRYPELLSIGLVARVPAAQLKQFEAYLARNPVEPLGPHMAFPHERFTILPAGPRPYYCFAVAGQSRSLASYLPAGLDFCALASELAATRDTGVATYAPFKTSSTLTLGVQTPVYRGGLIPRTTAARERAFIGWLGELLEPNVLLSTALAGTPTQPSPSATTQAAPTWSSAAARANRPMPWSRRSTCTTAGPSGPPRPRPRRASSATSTPPPCWSAGSS